MECRRETLERCVLKLRNARRGRGHHKLQEARWIVPYGFRWEGGPADTVILDLCLQNCRTFLLFPATSLWSFIKFTIPSTKLPGWLGGGCSSE